MNEENKVDLKEVIRNEFKRCVSDPNYFIRKYCVIQEPKKGRIPFDLYPYQEDAIHDFQSQDFNIILKARQIGISTVVACYALWMMTFHKERNILVIATKQDVAKEMISKVLFAYDNLPIWLQVPTVEKNKLSVKLKNGSRIQASSAASDAGRSLALSLLILDEAAFIRNVKEIWTASLPTLSTGGKAILISTPNGMGNFFHQKWVDATTEQHKNAVLDEDGNVIEDDIFDVKFNPILLDWRVHPERNEAWRKKMGILQGEREAEQEFDAKFIGSGNTVIDAALIEEYALQIKDPSQGINKEPIFKSGFDRNLWIWEKPDYTKQYMLVADVARGDGTDKSAFHVMDLESCAQVAEYKGVIGTKDYGMLILAVAQQFNQALVVVENANIGWAVLQVIIDKGYPNLFYQSKDLQVVEVGRHLTNKYNALDRKMIPGFTTSNKTRPLIISKLNTYMLDKSVIIRSWRLIEELRVFIWNGAKAEAMESYNDDLVIALCIGLWVRDVALKINTQNIELVKMALDRITRTGHEGIYTNIHQPVDPYRLPSPNPLKDDDMDLRWLLG